MLLRPKCAILVVIFAGLSSASTLAQPAANDLSALALQTHRASRQMVRSASCRVHFSYRQTAPKPPADESEGQFWYSNDAMRGKITGSDSFDFVWRDGVRKSLSERLVDEKPIVGAAIMHQPVRHWHRLDAFVRGLMVLHLPATLEYRFLEDLLSSSSASGAKWTTAGGKKLALFELQFEPKKGQPHAWMVQVFLDPSVNYLVRKIAYSRAEQPVLQEAEVKQFVEVSPGIFFPERIEGRVLNDGKVFATTIATISDIVVNQELPKDIFELSFPQNAPLTDLVRRVTYRVDKQGRQISSATTLENVSPSPPIETTTRIAATESTDEPKSATRWILPASLIVLTAALFIAWQRRRSRD